MNCKPNWDTLAFYGRIGASISHELKNVLAIINETGGLMQDLALLAAKGYPLEPEKLIQVCDKIKRQVERGDNIVKSMNAFAHSTDQMIAEIDIGQTMQILQAVCGRLLAARECFLEVSCAQPVMVRTSAFLVQQLVFNCLSSALPQAETGTVFEIDIKKQENKIVLTLQNLTYPDGKFKISEEIKCLIQLLQVNIDYDFEKEILHITWF